jgi:hypothetical protein
MTSRAFGIVLAVVVGTPLFAAGVIACVPPALAVGFSLGVAVAGVIGAVAGVAQILRWDHDHRSPHAAEVDALARRDRA